MRFIIRSSSDKEFDAEYLYIETGKFTADRGISMDASRRYVYRYKESTDAISAWFVKAEDPDKVVRIW